MTHDIRHNSQYIQLTNTLYAALITQFHLALFSVSHDGLLLDVTPEFAKLVGLDLGCQNPIQNFDYLFVDEKALQIWRETTNSGRDVHAHQVEWRRADGAKIWVRIDAVALPLETNSVARYQGLVTNITTLHQTCRSLRMLLEETTSLGYHELDAEGRITYVNDRELAILGFQRDEMVGRHVWGFVRERERERSKQDVTQKLQGNLQPGRRFYRTYLHRNGTPIPMMIDDRILVDAHGHINGITTILTNLSAKSLLEPALRQPDVPYLNLLTEAPLYVFRKNRDGVFTFANRWFCDTDLKKPLSDVLDSRDSDHYPEELARKYREDDNWVFSNRRVLETIELHRHRMDGDPFLVHVIKSPVFEPTASEPGEVQGVFWKVEDRPRVEQALTQLNSELAEQFRRIFENEVIGLYRSTPEGRYIDVNEALARMCGYGSAFEMKANVTDIAGQIFANSADRRRFQEEIERTGRVRGFECELRRKDGRAVWVSECAWTVRSADGNVVAYEGTVEDISERRDLFENATDIIFCHELGEGSEAMGKVTAANDAAVRALKFRRTELIGKDVSGIVGSRYEQELIAQLSQHGTCAPRDVELVTKNGQPVFVEANLTIIRRAGRRPEALVVARDLSHRHLEDIAARLALASQRALGLDDPEVLQREVRRVLLALTVADGLKAHRAIVFERREGRVSGLCAIGPFDRIEGSQYAETVGSQNITFAKAEEDMEHSKQPHRDRLHWDVVQTTFDDACLGGEVESVASGYPTHLDMQSCTCGAAQLFMMRHDIKRAMLCRITVPGGTEVLLILDWIYEGREEEAPNMEDLMLFTPILQGLLARANHLRERERQRDFTLHGIGNQMLMVENAVADLVGDAGMDAAKRAADAIRRVVKRVRRICQNVVSLWGTGRVRRSTELDLSRVVSESIAESSGSAYSMLFEFVPPAEPAAIEFDEDLLREILDELFSNAYAWRKHEQRTAEIHVSVEAVQAQHVSSALGRQVKGRWVRLTISDEGQGIADAQRSKLFSPYSSSKAGGLGIGLAAIRRILREEGSEILETSPLGEGARFEIFFPVNKRGEDTK